jgi:carboxymethylenebutenolidase
LDKHITPHVRSAVLEAVEAAGKPHASIVFSYADHAFNNDERPNYNPDASREGWALSMAFLKGRLQ